MPATCAAAPGSSVASIARLLGVSRSTIYLACRRPTTSGLDNQPLLDGSRVCGRFVRRGWPSPEVLAVSQQRAK
jgi:hypothetical protein